MLDQRTSILLDIINKNCVSGGYKVFLLEDLISAMPSAFDVDEQALLECLETLKNHEYISVKYQDDIEICLLALTKAKVESENRIEQEIEKMECQKQYFLASFLGGVAGGVVAGVLTLVIMLVGGK